MDDNYSPAIISTYILHPLIEYIQSRAVKGCREGRASLGTKDSFYAIEIYVMGWGKRDLVRRGHISSGCDYITNRKGGDILYWYSKF